MPCRQPSMFAQADRAAHEPPFGGVKVRARVQCASGVPEWSDPCKVILPEVWLYGLMEEIRMPQKRRKAEEIVTKLRQAEVLTARGSNGRQRQIRFAPEYEDAGRGHSPQPAQRRPCRRGSACLTRGCTQSQVGAGMGSDLPLRFSSTRS